MKAIFILSLSLWFVGILALEKRDSSQLSYELFGLQQLADLVDSSSTAEQSSLPQTSNSPLSSTFNSATIITKTSTPTATAAASTSTPTNTVSNTNSNTATDSTTIDNGYPDNSVSFSNLPTSSSFGNTIYAGAATFITPTPSASVSPLYPIQSNMNVTFKWQYTALRVRPVNITLNAVGPNSVTYPITVLDGASTEATWNLGSFPTNRPLMNGYYKIQLYDQRGLSAGYSPGWLAPCTTLSVALYTPDLYNTYSTESNYCPTCFYSSANSLFYETFKPLAITFGVAFISSALFIVKVMY